MQTVAVDILGPLPDSPAGNRYILVAMDYFTRWAEAYPIPNQEAATVAPKLVNEMFLRFSHMQTEHHHQKELYDKRVHGRPFQPGDLVWLHNSHVPPGQSKKLHVPWSGPHKVVKRLSECTYQIQGSRLHVVHFNRLKPFPSHTHSKLCSSPAEPRSFPRYGEHLKLNTEDDEADSPHSTPPPCYPSCTHRPPDRLIDHMTAV